ncbi:MAG: UDP-glucose/GDP-mannose dehydrogenase family protein [Oligoflexia bacterium]|nr:UDP-glucose/GDP-mannose dehydrogenase family protein [Oligoflexia bacterium]
MKIAVFGTGYVGLVAAVCFADSGRHVIGVDIDEEKVNGLRKGLVPIYEPGLDQLLKSTIEQNRIHFTTNPKEAVDAAEVIFIAVGTPEGEDGSADLTHVLKVAQTIAENMKSKKYVVLKSTVPVGTAEKVTAHMAKLTKVPFEIVSNPEFLKEGASIDDFLRPDRVVIGATSDEARKVMGELYAPFVKNGSPILFMSNKAAELTKYAANAFLATKISFINELANLADRVGADVFEVKKGFTSDKRIGSAFFYPGVGYGGSCFPKDVKALVKTGEAFGMSLEVIKATDAVNENQKSVILEKIRKHFGDVKGKTFAVWGLAFKPRTDDIREAPSTTIISKLLEAGARIQAYDSAAAENSQKIFGQTVRFSPHAMDALKDADALIVVTEWNEFRAPDLSEMKRLLKKPVIFDGRNVFEPKDMRAQGFTYYCIGREHA